jgi:hypothetical protein
MEARSREAAAEYGRQISRVPLLSRWNRFVSEKRGLVSDK